MIASKKVINKPHSSVLILKILGIDPNAAKKDN